MIEVVWDHSRYFARVWCDGPLHEEEHEGYQIGVLYDLRDMHDGLRLLLSNKGAYDFCSAPCLGQWQNMMDIRIAPTTDES